MALTLVSIKSSFQTYVGRIDTDTWVDGMIKTVQNHIVTEDFFDWTLDQNNRTHTLTASVQEYNLASLNPTWNIRKIKHVWFKDEAGARRGKLKFRDMAFIRERYPGPATFPNESIPIEYYIKDDGKTIGFIPIPDAAYILNIDFYTFPPDPASNDVVIPENFELVFLTFMAYLWHKKTKDFDAADRENAEYRTFLKPLLTVNNLSNNKDVRSEVKPFGTHRRPIRSRQRYTDSEWDSVAP